MVTDEFEILVVHDPELLVVGDEVLLEQLVETEIELLVETQIEHLVEQQTELLEIDRPHFEIIEIALQGPPGPPGINGSSTGAPYVTFLAGAPLGGNRAVRLDAGLVKYASSALLTDANLVLGITQSAADLGTPVQIQTSGLMTEPSWTWTVDRPVFCGANGTLTQTVPTAGFGLILGVALSAIQIFIGARMPIALT